MKKSYLTIGEKNYRVEANWNATLDYCDRKGVTELSALDNLGQLTPGDLTIMMHCCIKEGERMDGREFNMTELDLGGILRPFHIGEFVRIYQEQSIVEVEKGTKKK